MLPEIVEQKSSELDVFEEPEVVEVHVSKIDFDTMMDIVENPPELPEYLLGAASWYNETTK